MKKLLALLLALTMATSLVACGGGGDEQPKDESKDTPAVEDKADETKPEDKEEVKEEEPAPADLPIAEMKRLAGHEYGVDYTALYQQFGKKDCDAGDGGVTIDQVIEDEETGDAYIERDGKLYTLGLDFLSRAMVYNTTVPEGGDWETEDDVYATWWRLYMTRWNKLLPEIPLYSNEYYDLYNAKIKGVEEYPTNPYWGPTKACIDWTSDDGTIIFGSGTELSGKFRYPSFGGSSPAASDHDVGELVSGLDTVVTTIEGGYTWNDTVVAEHTEVDNADGSRTYTIKIYDDMKFSDGSPVTAKNYLAFLLAYSTPVAAQAEGKDRNAGLNYVGFEDFHDYTGPGSEKGTKEFSGVRLLGDYEFSVTVKSDFLPYFYAISYAGFAPVAQGLWLDDSDIMDDGNGCYLTDDFYEKNGDVYVMKDHIFNSAWDNTSDYPFSGAYTVEKWNDSDLSAVLKLNPEFKGDYRGHKPSIETIVYKKAVNKTQLEDLKSGGLDVLAAITGGDATHEALALAEAEPDKYVYTHYSRAGYGKLGFRADFGPTQFTEVRQAIAYCMDRAKFAKDFTGGFGGVVDGPYYSGAWMYKAAIADGMMLDAYSTSADSAIKVLEEGGWNFNADGSAYSGAGVRYKEIPAAEMDERDITFQSKDGAYVTTKVGDNYYMPLCLNWYGTEDNEFTELLMTGFMSNQNLAQAGFVVQNTIGQFGPMLDELYQAPVYGMYGGTPLYTCFNFATSFNSAAYDFSFNLTIDPAEYDNYSQYYIKDEADAYWFE